MKQLPLHNVADAGLPSAGVPAVSHLGYRHRDLPCIEMLVAGVVGGSPGQRAAAKVRAENQPAVSTLKATGFLKLSLPVWPLDEQECIPD